MIYWRTKSGQAIPVRGRSEIHRVLEDQRLGAKYWCPKCHMMVEPFSWETHKYLFHSGGNPQ